MSMTLIIAKAPEDIDLGELDNLPTLGDPETLKAKTIAFAGDAVDEVSDDSVSLMLEEEDATLNFEADAIHIEGMVYGELLEMLRELAKHLDAEANLIFCDG